MTYRNSSNPTPCTKTRILNMLLYITAICFVIPTIFSQNIPLVQEMKITKGILNTNRNFEVTINNQALEFEKSYLIQHLNKFRNKNRQTINPEAKVKIHLNLVKKGNYQSDEAYDLRIQSEAVLIQAKHPSGIFRGLSTFIQLYAHEEQSEGRIPALSIQDYPKFSWRGMHLDVSRHFFDVAFIKKYIDLLALYKMNVFHWHLTDDQGWRIEIKKYPLLTEIGGWRKGTMVGPYSDQKFNDIRYGGFYTQEEIKEVVRYAQERHITVVPEIEMPGHAMAALAAYPQFSCTGGPFEVAKGWGVFDDVFCAKEETFSFLEDILTEVLELFPSQYIHIGGDECPKVRWKTCHNCQKIITDNQLKDEHELQSYFIRRVERFLNSKGRKLIGWDEILEGGLAPGAAVMSWRGTEGGIAAAKMKHEAVMTPGSHCYFDHYQGDLRHEPLAFGGYTNLEKVYNYNPIPKELSKKEARYILGAQGNVWTEYMSGTVRMTGENMGKEANFWKDNMTPEQHVEYMVLPRLLALAEVTWGTANPKNYKEFLNRVVQHKKNILTPLNYNYSNSIYEISLRVFSQNGALYAELSSPLIKQIQVSLEPYRGAIVSDGAPDFNYLSAPEFLYTRPILISSRATLKYYHDFDGLYASDPKRPYSMRRMEYSQAFFVNKATAKEITLMHAPHKNYSFGGAFSLVNGIHARGADLSKDWLGFSGDDLIATINLNKETEVRQFGINVMERQGSWVYYPKSVIFEISNDGVTYFEAARMNSDEITESNGKVRFTLPNPVKAKYVRVTAVNFGIIPDGNPGAGSRAWLFADEILVD